MLPHIFIGSSKESLSVAEAMHTHLDRHAEVKIWTLSTGVHNTAHFDSIITAISKCDFAVFILTADDCTISRGNEYLSVRDNVIFEMGVAIGCLGKDRVFLVEDRNNPPSRPSDLIGIHFPSFDGSKADTMSALLPAMIEIRDIVTKLGKRTPSPSSSSYDPSSAPQTGEGLQLRVEQVLSRGDTGNADIIVDGAIYIVESKYQYRRELRKQILAQQPLQTKYFYYTEHACQLWLELCNKSQYEFFKNSMKHLKKCAPEIVSKVRSRIGHEVDFISLGVGNGEKDAILLNELIKELPKNKQVYFYPIDISEGMIIEAIKHTMDSDINLDRSKFHLKAIIGDIANLKPLQSIYEARPNNNLFSMLGNTMGNNDENAFMLSLRDGMLPGDMVLIEINVDQDKIDVKDPLLKDDVNRQHDFAPLASLGITYDAKLLDYRNEKNISVVSNTITTLASYKRLTIGNQQIRDIRLSTIHHYRIKDFITEMENRIGVETVFHSVEDGVGLILAQKV